MSAEQIDRNARMERDYRAGDTLKEIGGREGITAERVRQILRRRGVTRQDRGASNG